MATSSPDAAALWMQRARDHWRARRSTLTAVRETICTAILQKEDPFDAETLLEECRKRDGLISLSTIYRTLKHLVEAELVTETEGIDNRRLFRVRLQDVMGDSMIVCTDCNQAFPVENPCLALRESETARRMGFTPKRMQLRLDTACNELRDTGDCTRRKESDS